MRQPVAAGVTEVSGLGKTTSVGNLKKAVWGFFSEFFVALVWGPTFSIAADQASSLAPRALANIADSFLERRGGDPLESVGGYMDGLSASGRIELLAQAGQQAITLVLCV
jgi:hypothetical protein